MRTVRRTVWLALLGLFVWAAAPPLGGQAQESPPIKVDHAAVHYTFGQQATFELEASASGEITAAYLYLQEEGEERTEVYPVPVERDSQVSVRYVHDLHANPFPAFARVLWWWELRDADGNVLRTEPLALWYADNRFEWKTSENGQVRIHTTTDDPVYVQAALNVTQASLREISEQLDTTPPEKVDIYVYPSVGDIQAALQMAGREWASGQAIPDLGVVLVAVTPDRGILPQMERQIPHELTHLMVYHVVGERGYRYLPAWLDEGLATANELNPDPLLDSVLEEARSQNGLIPLSTLCAPFPKDPEEALLAYAESASLVRYIRRQWGDRGIRALLEAYADGAGCEGGVHLALGIGFQRLELAWHADLMGLSGWLAWVADNRDWLLLWGISLLVVAPMAWAVRRHPKPGTDENGLQ